jgi:hypothetical protein
LVGSSKISKFEFSENSSFFQARLFCDKSAKSSLDLSPHERFSIFLLVSWNSKPYVDIILPILSLE